MGDGKFDIQFIKPFISGTVETLKVQCEQEVTVGKPYAKKDGEDRSAAICGIIGLTSKTFNGSIALCFPEPTFLAVMSSMLGEEFKEIDGDLEDGAGELLNIIFGFAKRNLNEKGYQIEKAIPTVVRGAKINIQHLSKKPSVIVPFTTKTGDFYIEICFD